MTETSFNGGIHFRTLFRIIRLLQLKRIKRDKVLKSNMCVCVCAHRK